MDQQSIFFTSLVAICATALLLILISFLSKKKNISYEKDQKMNLSYAIWISSIFIVFFMFLKPALELVENTIEIIIYSKTIDNTFMAVMQKIIIFSGFTFLFTFMSYYIVHNLSKLIYGNRLDAIEIEKNNSGYFLVKGILLVGFAYSLIPIFQHFLNWFMPVVDTPFYH